MEEPMTERFTGQRRAAAAAMIVLAMAALLASGCGSSSHGSATTGGATTTPTTSSTDLAPVRGTYAPKTDPADFVATVDNPYFPLRPGAAFHYVGVAEDGKTPQTDDMVVTQRTRKILGVTATVVRDTVSSHGRAIERTFDWYAQDKNGNVWYLGEDTRDLKNGRFVKGHDSWQAGVDGAKPGIIMPARPQPGDAYRQEFYPRHAEDQARVLGSGGSVTVPSGSYAKTLLTEETSPRVDPGVAERKYYVAGVGDVKEQTIKGDHERLVLVRATP
jgi:hypothetical protein